MSKKKFDGILKGLAAAGVVTGGAGIVQDTDVVFAQTLEEQDTEACNNSEEVIEEEQQERYSTFAMRKPVYLLMIG